MTVICHFSFDLLFSPPLPPLSQHARAPKAPQPKQNVPPAASPSLIYVSVSKELVRIDDLLEVGAIFEDREKEKEGKGGRDEVVLSTHLFGVFSVLLHSFIVYLVIKSVHCRVGLPVSSRSSDFPFCAHIDSLSFLLPPSTPA